MLSEPIQDRAALYVSGAMTGPEQESFEVVLEFHDELRAHVAALKEAVTAVVMSRVPLVAPPAGLKTRVLEAVEALPRGAEPEALVVTDPAGRIEWVNAGFTAMCGYSLGELTGRKPGHLLQGPATDPAAMQRIREALQTRQACRETLVNYHKDGRTYRVDIRISPVLDDDDRPLWFVARERELPEGEAVPQISFARGASN
jgi:PAS domain S-box-containing protein